MDEQKEVIAPNIFQRIRGVMSELDYVQKGEKQVNGQYRFASHDQVTAALHPYLVKYGIVVIPTVEEMTQENNRTVVKLAVVFRNCDSPIDAFHVHYYGYGVDSGDKGPGKAISYALKYALLKTFMLETGEDADNDANALYEPVKCLEFDIQLPIDMNEADRNKMNKFLDYSAKAMNKHVEDVKREALTRMPEFLAAFRAWKPKKTTSSSES
jgi:hypothetical protein